MMSKWYLYETLLGNGEVTDSRSAAIEEAVRSFTAGMVDDPAYQSDALVNGVQTPIIASRSSSYKCAIKAAPDADLCIGDMVECLGEMWIVVELYADKVGIINGEMWLCNNIIKFQNGTPSIILRHCVIDDGTYSKRSSDPDAYVMSNTYKIYITIDESTKRLYVDKRIASGKIFSSDGSEILEVYKIIGMDVKSKNFGEGSHLMVLTMQRDVYDPQVDSLNDNICDMVTETSDVSEPENAGECVITGRESIRIGTTRKYLATFIDAQGKEVSGIACSWSISAPDAANSVIDGNSCSISIPLDESLVGSTISITATDSSGLFGTYEKKVQVITVG